MLICLRHGHTHWNSAKAAGDVEVLRGHDKDVDLDAQGQQEIHEAATEICGYPVIQIKAALTYKRDASSAQIVSQVCGAPIKDTPGLAPWNPGALTGMPVELIWDVISLLIDVPFISPPGGETIGSWLGAFTDFFRREYKEFGQDDTRAEVLIVHGMEMRALPVVMGTGEMEKYQQQSVKPGEFVVIH